MEPGLQSLSVSGLHTTSPRPGRLTRENESVRSIKTRAKASDQWHRFFSVGDEKREFMYLAMTATKAELKPWIRQVKGQGDLYRVTRLKRGAYIIWDARP